MPTITFFPDDIMAETDGDETILEIALRSGIPHTNACGGEGRCSTCRVLVLDGSTGCDARNEVEQKRAEQLRFRPEIRLACQAKVDCDLRVRRLVLDAEDEVLTDQRKLGSIPGPVGEEQQMAILFADIAGFSEFAESLLPYDVIYSLNRYFFEMDKAIISNGGRIANYMGDGLMALFIDRDPHQACLDAVCAGFAMHDALAKLNEIYQLLYQHELEIRIGAHYGSVIVGIVGAPTEGQLPTAIGDPVNLSSRIEQASKNLGTNFLISADLYSNIRDSIQANRHDGIEIKGKSGSHTLYEPLELL